MVGAQRIRLGTLLAAAASPTCPWCRGHAEIKTLQPIFNNMAIFTWVIDATIGGAPACSGLEPVAGKSHMAIAMDMLARHTHNAHYNAYTTLHSKPACKFTLGPEDFVCHVVYCVHEWPEMQFGRHGNTIGH